MSETHDIPDAKCKACGANSTYSPATGNLKCDYCGTTEEIAPPPPAPKSSLESVQAQMIAPASITEEDMVSSLHNYMTLGKYTPDDILERHAVLSIDRFYRPAFVFKGAFQAHWTASFGYEREETYNVREQNDKGYMVWVTKTRKVTDWRPASGTSQGDFCFVGYAGSQATTPAGLDLASLVEGCKAMLQPWNASYLTGTNCESFALSPNETYRRRVTGAVERDIGITVQSNAQGDYQKDWNWTSSTSWDSTSLLLPLCRLKFEYDGKTYEFWVDGTNAKRYRGDALPEDTGKKNAVYRSFIPVGLYTACLGVALYLVGFDQTLAPTHYVPWLTLGAGVAISLERRHSLLKYSKQYRQYAAYMAKQESTILANPQKATPPRRLKPGVNPAYDKISLPIFTTLLLAFGIGPLILAQINLTAPSAPQEKPHSAPTPAAPATPATPAQQDMADDQSMAPAPEAPPSPPLPQPVAPHGQPMSAPPFDEPVNVGSNAVSPPLPSMQPATPAPVATPNAETGIVFAPLNALLMASRQGDWAQVEQDVATIRASEKPVVHGDRHAARTENEAGLQLLKNNDFAQANQLFLAAFSKDNADMEIANNLGYSFLKIGDYPHCIRILSILLMHNPVRSAAWINIAEAEARLGNGDAALSALRLTIYFNHNRTALQSHFRDWSMDENQPELWRRVLAGGLRDMDTIPDSSL